MYRFLFAFVLTLFAVNLSQASPPGSASLGQNPQRINGRIVYQPYDTGKKPYYYQGNVMIPSQGAAYRDSSGKIQYDVQYQAYPFHEPTVNYQYERQRIRDVDRSLDQSPYGQYPPPGYRGNPNQGYYNNNPGYQGYPNQGYYNNNPGYQGYPADEGY